MKSLTRFGAVMVIASGLVAVGESWLSIRKIDARMERQSAIKALQVREEKLWDEQKNLTREEYFREAYFLQQEYSAAYRDGELEMDRFFIAQTRIMLGIQVALLAAAVCLFIIGWCIRATPSSTHF